MRTFVLPLLTALASVHTVHCQLHIRYTSDVYGRYAPFNSDGECYPSEHTAPALKAPPRLEISSSEDADDAEAEDLLWDEAAVFWKKDCVGGAARQSYYLRLNNTGADRNASYLSVSAGNLLNRGEWEVASGYAAAAAAASVYDVLALGPEELRRGAEFLQKYLTSIRSVRGRSVLACNLHSPTLNDTVDSWRVLDAFCAGAGCQRHSVGVVGFVDPGSVMDTLGFLDPLIQLSNLSCVQEAVQQIRAENTTYAVIATGSIASLERLKASGILDLGLDAVILSGLPQSNKTYLKQHKNALDGYSTYVLTAETFGTNVGDFELTANASNSYAINGNTKNDNVVYGSISRLQAAVRSFFTTKVEVAHTLTSTNCDRDECSMGDILTDAMLVGGFVQRLLGSNTTDHPNPIAIWPASNIWNTSIEQGEATVRDIYSKLPGPPANGNSQIALLTTDGATVISTFCRAVSGDFPDQSEDAFLQVSGVHVTYDLDLAADRRAKYLMNLCFDCAPQEYLAVSPSLNYTLLLPSFMLAENSPWSELLQQRHHLTVTDFEARDVVAGLVSKLRYLRAPVGGRIGFTHYVPERDGSSDSFIAVLVTIVVCMVIFGVALLGFRMWSSRQTHGGSVLRLIN